MGEHIDCDVSKILSREMNMSQAGDKLIETTLKVANEISNQITKNSDTELNFFSKFIEEFSEDMPFFYGLFSIMFAVILGIGAAFIRRFLSNLRKKYLIKAAK